MIYDLRTEYSVQPLNIDTQTPRFFWKWKGDGEYQIDYRIQIFSAIDGKPVWDSGVVESDACVGVTYAGKPLNSFSRYNVKVTVNGGKYCIESFFETAAFSEKDFKAHWISMPYLSSGTTLLIRTEFVIPENKKIIRARAYVAGLGCHKIYLNGKEASDEILNPQISVYSKRVFYNVYSLDVNSGLNVFGVELGNGWYPMRTLFAQIMVEFADGTRMEHGSSHGWDWKCHCGAVTENSIYGGENYDARLYSKTWCTDKEDVSLDNGWIFTCLAEHPSGKLCSQKAEAIKVVKTFNAVAKYDKEGNRSVYDFSKNICGRLKIKVKGDKGAKVIMTFAECIDENNELLRHNLRAAKAEDTYILAGDGEEEYAPSFTYHGFRYAQIKVEGNVDVISVIAEHLRSSLEISGEFLCSDETLNTLHEMAALTESNNLNGVYTDCPQRDERIGWLNDLTSRIYQSVCNFDNSKLLPSFIQTITDGQLEKGEIHDTAPHILGGTPADPVSAYIILGLFAYNVYGDLKTLEENYAGFEKWFDYLSGVLVDGTLELGLYGDWVPASIYAIGGGESPFSSFVTPQFVSAAYYVWYCRMMSEIAVAIGKLEDAERYQAFFKKAKDCFHKKYYNESSGVYGGGGQTENSVVATAFCDKELTHRLMDITQKDIVEKGYHTTCGNQGYRHLFYRLAESGYIDTLIKLLINPEYPGWGYMVVKGATTVWERWENTMCSTMHSYNHPMFASYDAFFYEFLAGIRIQECKNAVHDIIVELPKTEILTSAKAVYKTIRGDISCEWKKENNNNYIAIISTPANTNLTVKAKKIHEVNCKVLGDCDTVNLSNGKFIIRYEI